MADGVRLAADLYRPDRDEPVAALLEALPYRKDDITAVYRPEYDRLVNEGGFVVCRVDVRGTGSSEGDATDEYPVVEQRDLAEVIAWLAGQPWSNGRVGMFGTSYSGFNAIQVACERPPGLGAILAIYATDDRYTDDVHYMGGVLRAVDLVDYCHYMTPMNALPPVPEVFGDGWREEWRRRIGRTEPWLLRWLREQRDGPYWRHGSLRPHYDRITCPTMLVGGWADGYRNNSLRTFAALRCPKALLMGPWSHMSTATSLPGPHIDLVPEMIQWFGRWLRDEDNGVDREPPIRVFVRHATRPEPDLAEHEGVWRAEPGWPLERSSTLDLTAAGSGDDVLAVPTRRRHQRVDLLRRAAAVGPTAGPARRRRLVADVRLAGRPRAPSRSSATLQVHLGCAARPQWRGSPPSSTMCSRTAPRLSSPEAC